MGLSRRLWAYVALVFALSLPCYILAGTGSGWAIQVTMLMPAIAAMIVVFVTTRSLRGLGWGLGKPRYLVYGFLIPIGYCVVAYGIVWATGIARFTTVWWAERLSAVGPTSILLSMATLIAISIPLTLGEELGWRGFMMPEIIRTKPWGSTVAFSALIWVAWHVPSVIWGGYNAGTPLWYGLFWFALFATAATVVLAWLRFASDSVWPAVAFHLANNLFVQAVFDPATGGAGAKWILGEFGPALAIVLGLIAILVWRRGARAAEEWKAAHVSAADAVVTRADPGALRTPRPGAA
jgi:membrane protease YdiL (CAAX protease family)